MENTASNTSINIKSDVKLPREVKGNVLLLMLNSVLADELLSYVLAVVLKMVLVTIRFHCSMALLYLETLTLLNWVKILHTTFRDR